MKSVSKGWPGSEMLTRRTATVTISAPEAATAAAFCSKLLYLPVPTMSREVKLLPATVQPSFAPARGAAIRPSAFTSIDPFVRGLETADIVRIATGVSHGFQNLSADHKLRSDKEKI